MTKLSPGAGLALFLLPAFVFFSCKDILTVDNTDQDFPVELRSEAAGETIRFSWDAAQISTFENYFLVRSALPIPAGLTPFSSSSMQIVFQNDRPDTTVFVDVSPPLFEEVYYKLYIDIGERFVESAALKISFDNFLLPGDPAIVKYWPDSNWLIIANTGNGSLQVVDYEQKTVRATLLNVPFTGAQNIAVAVSQRPGEAPRLYWWSGYSSPLVLNLPDLVQLQSFPASAQPPFSLVVAPNGNFFATLYDYDNGFRTLNSSDFSLIEGYYRTNYYDHRTLLQLDADQGLLLEATSYSLRTFTVDETTGVISNEQETSGNTGWQAFLHNIPVSPDGQYFIPRLDGYIYERNLNFVQQITGPGNGFVDFAFSPDGDYVYALSNDPFAFGSLIQKFRFPGLEFVDERRLNGATARDIEATDNGLVFLGANVNGFSNLLIKKLNF